MVAPVAMYVIEDYVRTIHHVDGLGHRYDDIFISSYLQHLWVGRSVSR